MNVNVLREKIVKHEFTRKKKRRKKPLVRKNEVSVWRDKGNLFIIEDKLTLLRFFFCVVFIHG